MFLMRDAVTPPALPLPDRAARRLCERLAGLDALHELTGRDIFRLSPRTDGLSWLALLMSPWRRNAGYRCLCRFSITVILGLGTATFLFSLDAESGSVQKPLVRLAVMVMRPRSA